jgi:hypothetical protein
MKCDGFGNLINHSSNLDGTKRSAKACYIINTFNPKNAKELGEIISKNSNPSSESIYLIGIPMFFNDERLVKFCEKNSTKPWINNCVSSTDSIDLPADMCKLSPLFAKKYPGEKWHQAVREFEATLRGGHK